MAGKRIADEDIRVLFRNDGDDESKSCSEDELHISSDDDGANDILLSYPGSDYNSSNGKRGTESNDGFFDNRNTYIMKSCNGSEDFSYLFYCCSRARQLEKHKT